MCTALTLKSNDNFHFFGRNMDLEYNFGQTVLNIPKEYLFKNTITGDTINSKYVIMGMGTIIDSHPMLADAFNEKGLAMAGLNFPQYTQYSVEKEEGKINLAPYDLMSYCLANFDSVKEARQALINTNIVGIPFAKDVPLPTLHFIMYDKSGECIVLENTEKGLEIHENKIGVLANAPEFLWHKTNLNMYANLNIKNPEEIKWNDQRVTPPSVGSGLLGLPGDFSSASRFLRTAFLKTQTDNLNSRETTLIEFFHILNNVAMISGSVIDELDKSHITIYTSAMCLEDKIYYYKTYENPRINAIKMDMTSTDIKIYNYENKNSINFQN